MNAIRKALIDYLEPGLKIRFVRKNKIDREKSGKLKQFTSLVKK
jgi:phenylacetate-CoA ligase